MLRNAIVPHVMTVDVRPPHGWPSARNGVMPAVVDAVFTAVWAGATNVLGPPVIPWTERSYAGVLDPK